VRKYVQELYNGTYDQTIARSTGYTTAVLTKNCVGGRSCTRGRADAASGSQSGAPRAPRQRVAPAQQPRRRPAVLGRVATRAEASPPLRQDLGAAL
jgi:hypothetical protein